LRNNELRVRLERAPIIRICRGFFASAHAKNAVVAMVGVRKIAEGEPPNR